MNVYISGPITGQDLWKTKATFYKVWCDAVHTGHSAVDPTDMYSWDLTWETYMRIALDILESGEIDLMIMLPGWRKSKGACVEHYWAKNYGIRIAYQTESGKYSLEGDNGRT